MCCPKAAKGSVRQIAVKCQLISPVMRDGRDSHVKAYQNDPEEEDAKDEFHGSLLIPKRPINMHACPIMPVGFMRLNVIHAHTKAKQAMFVLDR